MSRPGFTLMELMVAIGILVIIILAVGVTFSSASKAVGVSQATMEMMANVRATQELLARDFSGLDKNGFLVIRCRALDATSPSSVENGLRFDQISFMSYGNFPDRTGTTQANSTFTNSASSNAGLVWWGQLVMEKQGGSTDPTTLGNPGPAQSYVAPNQALLSDATWLNGWPGVLPTGAFVSANSPYKTGIDVTKTNDGTLIDNNFYLGRHAFVLMPPAGYTNGELPVPGGNPVMAFPNPSLAAGNTVTDYDGAADIASSRYDVVAQSAAQLMAMITQADNGKQLDSWVEPFYLTYRFRALASPYDVESTITTNPFADAYFRSTPLVMKGVSSFKVEWTDGTSWTQNDLNDTRENPTLVAEQVGQLKWYGPTHLRGGAPTFERNYYLGNFKTTATGDQYIATFNQSNRAYWPKAIRITMHVGSDRLQGGRDFVQVINLPE